jgi:hypothetical protein
VYTPCVSYPRLASFEASTTLPVVTRRQKWCNTNKLGSDCFRTEANSEAVGFMAAGVEVAKYLSYFLAHKQVQVLHKQVQGKLP